LNQDIDCAEVRLIDADGGQVGVVSITVALDAARTAKLDLVEIQPHAEPPVCRLMDYGKHRFKLKKDQSDSKKKQKQVQIKEIKIRPVTEEGDYQVKLRNLKRFLGDGNKVKVTMRFRGRELSHQEIGMAVMERIMKDSEDAGLVETMPKFEGRQIVMILSAVKVKAQRKVSETSIKPNAESENAKT
jgi:translation initiation factor IF-3